MQRRHDLVREPEDRFVATSRLTYPQALALYEAMWEEAMWEEACPLGILPPEDPWEGLDVDLHVARVLASCSPGS